MERTRLLASLLATGLLASCGGSSNDLASRKDAHVLQECTGGLTPGFWCGGASPITKNEECQAVGFPSCHHMCECFHEANAKKGVNSDFCGVSVSCNGGPTGMEDVLVKFWAAFRLSFDGTFNEFLCPAAECGPENLCDATDVAEILQSCDRERQEAAKDCLDTILNEGGLLCSSS